MGQKINKKKLLKEIEDKLSACKLYQKQTPDESTKKRVEVLDKNPCLDGTYYTVVTLKDAVSVGSTNIDDLLKSERRRDCSIKFINEDDFKKIFYIGCIIKYDLKKDIVTVENFTNLLEMLDAMINYGLEKNTKILKFNPSSGSIFSAFSKYSCLKDDYKSYKDSYDVLYYSIGRIKDGDYFIRSENELEDDKTKLYNSESELVYSVDIPFTKVPYVNETRLTSFEKNVNRELDEDKLNEVTNLNEKSEVDNFDLCNQTVVDFGNFVLNRISELKRSDQKLISEYTKNYQYVDSDTAKYNAYLAFNGSDELKNWEEVYQNYNRFRSLISDEDFYERSMENDTYRKSIKAEEMTSFLFSNNSPNVIKYYNSNLLNVEEFEVLGFGDYINSYIKEHFIEPISYSVSGFNNKLTLKNDLGAGSYKLTVPVKLDSDDIPDTLKKSERFVFLSDPDEEILKVIITVTGTNVYTIQRDSVWFGSTEYKFGNFNDVKNAKNEITSEFINGSIENVYFCEGTNSFFSVDDLSKRILSFNINYTIIPKSVDVMVKTYCAEESQYKETCEIALNKETAKYGENILRACIDIIPYDPWEIVINKLRRVYNAFSKIPANEDGYIIVPPGESDLAKQKNTKCKQCGKTKNLCECEEIKLCNKIFPVDLFGVTGLLGVDDLLSKFGLFNVNSSIINQMDKPVTYIEAAHYFYTQLFPEYETNTFGFEEEVEVDEAKFESDNDRSKKVCDLTYDDIKTCPEFTQKNSIANQISKEDFEKFIKTYKELIEEGDVKTLKSKTLSRELKVGIADGYAYIPTGRSVTYSYNFFLNSFTVKGWGMDPISAPAFKELFDLILSLKTISCEEYVTKAIELKNKYKIAFDMSEDAQINLVYPYMPDILSLLGQSSGDKENDVLGYNFAFMYIPSPESIKSLISEIGNPKLLDIKFDIYTKEPIKCGFPQDKNPKCRGENNGKCGLEELFKNPINTGTVKFDFDKEISKLKNKVTKKLMEKELDETKKNLKSLIDYSCDIEQTLESITISKSEALDSLYTVGKEMAPMLNLFPAVELDGAIKDGAAAICEASRKAQDKSVIEDFGDSFEHKIKTVGILWDESINKAKQKVSDITTSFKNAVGPIVDSTKNLIDNASIYNLCEERFGDYMDNSGIAKSFGEGLSNIMKADALNSLKGVLRTNLINGVLDSALGGMDGILQAEKGEFIRIIESGDPDAIDALGKRFPNIFDQFGTNVGGINFDHLINQSPINTNFLQSFETEITKRLNPKSLMSSVGDKFTDPSNLVNFAQSAAKEFIKSGPTDTAMQFVNQAKGLGLEGIDSHLQSNIASTLERAKNKKDTINTDILTSINSYVKEKAELYEIITNGKEKIPGLDA